MKSVNWSYLTEPIKVLFNKLTGKSAFIVTIIISVLVFSYLISPEVSKYIENSEKRQEERYLKEYKIKAKLERRLDSIKEVNKIRQNEIFIMKNNRINDLISYLEKRFDKSSHITIFSIHNGGGVPKTGSESKMSALYTSDNIRGVNILKEYASYPLYRGYAEFAYQLLNKRGYAYYIEDVKNYPKIYNGETKNSMDYLGTKSVYGFWIKSSSTHTYYIAVAFDFPYGMDENRQYKEQVLQQARVRLLELIDSE